MIITCMDCEKIFDGHPEELEKEHHYGLHWRVTQKKVTCPECVYSLKVAQQYERDRKLSPGTIAGDTATLFQLSIRLAYATCLEEHYYAKDGEVYARPAPMGQCQCVTCGKRAPYNSGIHGGHFYKRNKAGTLLDDFNVHPQCVGCNEFADGKYEEYRLFMAATYSKKELDDLLLRSNGPGLSREDYARKKVELRYDIKRFEKILARYGVD